MTLQERLATNSDLRAIETLPENREKRFELMAGVIYAVRYPTPTHNLIVGNIYSAIRAFVKTHKLGYPFADSVNYSLPNGDEFAPDISFLSYQRQSPPIPKHLEIAPDMAVEVASPGNRGRELIDKAESLLMSGTRFVWIVYPTASTVDVYHLNPDASLNTCKYLGDGVLEGEDVLPGFTLAVADIFAMDEP